MASIKISELNNLSSVSDDDYIPIVDSGSSTTYHTPITSIGNWIAVSGSVISSSYALSASGVPSASYSVSSSWSNTSLSSSYALSASYFDLSGYIPTLTATASYAINADHSVLSDTASCLHGNGTSWEQNFQISSSLILEKSSSVSVARKINVALADEPLIRDTIFLNKDYGTDPNSSGFIRIYYTEPVQTLGRLVFEHGDSLGTQHPMGPNLENIYRANAGFLWGTIQNSSPYPSASLLFLSRDGKLYGRSMEARDFSQSLENQVGFYGTASFAVSSSHSLTASYIISSGGSTPSTSEDYSVEVSETSLIELDSRSTFRQIQVDHNLSGFPDVVTWEFVCKTAIHGYSIGDTISIFNVKYASDKDNTQRWNNWGNPYYTDTVCGVIFGVSAGSADWERLYYFNKTTSTSPTLTEFLVSYWQLRGRFIYYNRPTLIYPSNYLRNGATDTPGSYCQFSIKMVVVDDGLVNIGATYSYTSVIKGGAGVATFSKNKLEIPIGSSVYVYTCLESDATNFVLVSSEGGTISAGPSSTGTGCTP